MVAKWDKSRSIPKYSEVENGDNRATYLICCPNMGVSFFENRIYSNVKIYRSSFLFLDVGIWNSKGYFTHETEGLWPLRFKYSHWLKRWSWSKFASHYTWGTNGVSECKMDVKFAWIPTWYQMNHVSWSIGLSKNNHLLVVGLIQNREITALWNFTVIYLLYCIICDDPAWMEDHWNSIWLRA